MKALKAVEEHIGRALHEEGPQETLEVLNSVVRVLQTLSIEKSLVDSCFSLSLSNSVISHQSSIASS